MKITKRMREEAAMICAIAASMPVHDYDAIDTAAYKLGLDYGAQEWRAVTLAWFARNFASRGNIRDRATDAEAAQLLWEGWTPEGWS